MTLLERTTMLVELLDRGVLIDSEVCGKLFEESLAFPAEIPDILGLLPERMLERLRANEQFATPPESLTGYISLGGEPSRCSDEEYIHYCRTWHASLFDSKATSTTDN